MDPLSALAIAAAVIQFVDIGAKLVDKAWDIYTQAEKKEEEERKKERTQLEQTSGELSFLIDGIDSAAATLPPHGVATPAQSQLLELCSGCHNVATEFSHVLSRIRKERDREYHLSACRPQSAKGGKRAGWTFSGAGMSARSGQRVWSGAANKKAQRGGQGDEDIRTEAVAEIQERLKSLRRDIIDSVILCLWENSKRTKQWEVHFSNQLDAIASLVEEVDETTRGLYHNRPLDLEDDDFSTQHMHRTGLIHQNLEHVARGSLAGSKTLMPIAQASQTISLSKIRTDMVQDLNSRYRRQARIRTELISYLWDRDWKLDATTMESTAVDPQLVASAISKDLRFDTIQARETAITDSFEETYSWIFQEDPERHDNKPMWHSFPRWLADGHGTAPPLYWITGKPGSGKSTMMKYLLQSPLLQPMLAQWAEPLPVLTVRYYAWHAGSSLQKSFEGLKRTAISQALELRPELAPILAPRRWALYQVLRIKPHFPEWAPRELSESFDALLSECGKTFKLAVFVDGLDEVASPAKQVVELFRDIQKRCGLGMKLCVASRPWTDFDDAYSDMPMLEIHRITRADMIAFVTGRFREHKGFNEQRRLYPEAVGNLLTSIVDKADGVFLWVSVVVEHLLGLFASGRSIADVRQQLTALPRDLEELYHTIWATIQADELPNSAWMMQVVKAADAPVPWFTMWLIEESRLGPVDINAFPKSIGWKQEAFKILRRRLSARTKGILEVSWFEGASRGHVNFIHRTARDWVEKAEVWQRICGSTPEGFDPFLALIEAETLRLSDTEVLIEPHEEIWAAIMRILWCASEASDRPENAADIVRLLDSLDTALQRQQRQVLHNRSIWGYRPILDCWVFEHGTFGHCLLSYGAAHNPHWSSTQLFFNATGKLLNEDSTFLKLVAQFSILPYIVAKTSCDRALLRRQSSATSILENAIFGYSFYTSIASAEDYHPEIPCSRRLATVKFLLDQGVRPTKSQAAAEGSSWLRMLADVDSEYHAKVAEYLEKRDLKQVLKSVSLRVRSVVK